jgi:hypothetical protein
MLPPQMVQYQVPPGQPPRPYPPHMPNGYPAVPAGTMHHHGGLFHLLVLVFVIVHFDCQILVLIRIPCYLHVIVYFMSYCLCCLLIIYINV